MKAKARAVPLATLIADAVASNRFFYSFEYSAARDPRPEDLLRRVARMGDDLRPLWIDLTWGFGDVGARTVAAARHIQKANVRGAQVPAQGGVRAGLGRQTPSPQSSPCCCYPTLPGCCMLRAAQARQRRRVAPG